MDGRVARIATHKKKWFFLYDMTLYLTWAEQSRQTRYEVFPDYLNDDAEVTALDG